MFVSLTCYQSIAHTGTNNYVYPTRGVSIFKTCNLLRTPNWSWDSTCAPAPHFPCESTHTEQFSENFILPVMVTSDSVLSSVSQPICSISLHSKASSDGDGNSVLSSVSLPIPPFYGFCLSYSTIIMITS
jgi:hypothetical protein